MPFSLNPQSCRDRWRCCILLHNMVTSQRRPARDAWGKMMPLSTASPQPPAVIPVGGWAPHKQPFPVLQVISVHLLFPILQSILLKKTKQKQGQHIEIKSLRVFRCVQKQELKPFASLFLSRYIYLYLKFLSTAWEVGTFLFYTCLPRDLKQNCECISSKNKNAVIKIQSKPVDLSREPYCHRIELISLPIYALRILYICLCVFAHVCVCVCLSAGFDVHSQTQEMHPNRALHGGGFFSAADPCSSQVSCVFTERWCHTVASFVPFCTVLFFYLFFSRTTFGFYLGGHYNHTIFF